MDRTNSFFSDSMSRSGSVYSTSSYSSILDGPVDKSAHESDTHCNCCGSSFTSLKKNCCTFCYRGVCVNCFNKQATHADSQLVVKICDSCFDKQMSKGINLLEKLRNELVELKEKHDHEKRAAISELNMKISLEEELSRLIEAEKNKESSLLKQIHIVKEKNEKLENQVKVLELECEEKTTECVNLENRIKIIQLEAENLKEKYKNNNISESLKESLNKVKEDFEILKSEVESNENFIQTSKAEEMDLEGKRDKLKEEIERIEQEYNEIMVEVKDCENEENEQKSKLEVLEKSLLIFKKRESSSFIDMQDSRYTTEFNALKNSINKKERTIEKIKLELKKYENPAISVEKPVEF